MLDFEVRADFSFSFASFFSLSLPFFFGASSAFEGFRICAGTALVTSGLGFEAMVERLARRSSTALLAQLAVGGRLGASCDELEVSLLSCRYIGVEAGAAATAGPGWAGGAAREEADMLGCCVWIEFIMDKSWRVKLSSSSPGSCRNMQLRLLQASPRR